MSEVLIVGAGLAGLACGRVLSEAGIDFEILESTERAGGRVRTDQVDGFTLDHGFQVLLTAYPACQQLLDYESLRLRTFDPGAMVRIAGKFHMLGDPWRKPGQAFKTAFAPVGTLADKLRIAKLRASCRAGSLDNLYLRPQETTQSRLVELGFSESMIDHFFRPFFGGVFLEQELSTSSRMMEFVFRMFSSGPIAIPAEGMAAIARQLAEGLPRGSLRLNESVERFEKDGLRLSDGRLVQAPQTVLATESAAIGALLGPRFPVDEFQNRKWQKTYCLYFAAEQAPAAHKLLMLRGDEQEGPLNNVSIISNVAPEYAPKGHSLISVSIAGDKYDDVAAGLAESHLAKVIDQLRRWFGEQVDGWRHLHSYSIPYSLPKQDPEDFTDVIRSVEPWGTDGPVCCGDHRETSSIQGAMNSGIRAAETVLRRLGKSK